MSKDNDFKTEVWGVAKGDDDSILGVAGGNSHRRASALAYLIFLRITNLVTYNLGKSELEWKGGR